MTSVLLIKSMLYANAFQKKKKKKKLKLQNSDPIKLDKTMCRVCYDGIGNIPIFNNALQPNIPEDIKTFAGVTVSKTDDFPQYMCKSCLDLLNGCVVFRDLCQKTNERMVKISIQTSKKEHLEPFEYDVKNQNDTEFYYNTSSPVSDFEPDWTCNKCNKDFVNLVDYRKHLCNCKTNKLTNKPMKIKNKKKFLCDVCGKTASSRGCLQVHMAIHENIFPFKCDICPYRGRTMDLLKIHKRSHMTDKPFKCAYCPKSTTTSSNLAKHTRHVHSTSRPYKCNYCEKAFTYQHDMRRHVKDIHLRQGTVECNICFKKFNTKKILQGHQRKIHKVKCERTGRLPSYLQYHTDDQNKHQYPLETSTEIIAESY